MSWESLWQGIVQVMTRGRLTELAKEGGRGTKLLPEGRLNQALTIKTSLTTANTVKLMQENGGIGKNKWRRDRGGEAGFVSLKRKRRLKVS